MRKIGIVGSREYSDKTEVKWFIDTLSINNTTIVSGGARGVDMVAEKHAKKCGMKTIIHHPNKKRYGIPGAFKERNTLIVRDSDIIVAFWNGESRGTYDTIKKTLKVGKFVLWIDEEGDMVLISDIDQIPLTS